MLERLILRVACSSKYCRILKVLMRLEHRLELSGRAGHRLGEGESDRGIRVRNRMADDLAQALENVVRNPRKDQWNGIHLVRSRFSASHTGNSDSVLAELTRFTNVPRTVQKRSQQCH